MWRLWGWRYVMAIEGNWWLERQPGLFHFKNDGDNDCDSASLEDGETSDDKNTLWNDEEYKKDERSVGYTLLFATVVSPKHEQHQFYPTLT